MYGIAWLDKTVRLIIEDKQEMFRFLASVVPLAQTAGSEEQGRALKRYSETVFSYVDGLTPWRNTGKGSSKRPDLANLRKTVKSGTVVVITDDSDAPGDALYKDATIMR